MSNLPTIDEIHRDPRIITALPWDALKALLETIQEASQKAAYAKRAVTNLIEDRLSSRIANAYVQKGVDTGTVRIEVGDGLEAKVVRAKRVEWDQGKLAAIAQEIAASGDDPTEYLDVTYSVPEKKFASWPALIARKFEPARTVRPGATSIELVPVEVAEAA